MNVLTAGCEYTPIKQDECTYQTNHHACEVPLAAGIIFGTQRVGIDRRMYISRFSLFFQQDILRAWKFWKYFKNRESTEKDSDLQGRDLHPIVISAHQSV